MFCKLIGVRVNWVQFIDINIIFSEEIEAFALNRTKSVGNISDKVD